MSNIRSMLIHNSLFEENDATIRGGAIYTDCDETDYLCSINMTGLNNFTKNYANESGGAIYWKSTEPRFVLNKTVYFANNSALIYANDIGCFAA